MGIKLTPSFNLAGHPLNLVTATKTDPNSLESAAPSSLGSNQFRITLKSPATVGSTPDQALTYTAPLKDILGSAVSVAWIDLMKIFLVAGEAAPVDVRIMVGFSEGGVPATTRKGIAAALTYSAGNWLLQTSANTAGVSWSAWGSAAGGASASTRIAELSGQAGALATQGTHAGSILDAAGAPISLTNGGLSTNRALTSPAFDYFFVGADWVTGTGGTAGETIDLKAIATCLGLITVPNVV